MKAIVIFLTTQFAALIGYYLGRFLGPFAINKFTFRFLQSLRTPFDEINPDWFNMRLIQRFGSAGSGICAPLVIYCFIRGLHIRIPVGSWIVASLIVAWFAASNGSTGRWQCSLIAFGFFWFVSALLLSLAL
jgi:hypothetical protein